ncbi:MAG: hypothetical protein JWM46_696 [Candidatus Kaiserbacteria bacterium]|nr:hypothetical protein [Candidatus Kaiserbacteria bacterium]
MFKRTKEDFVCEHCGTQVKGNGYTNHCPKCLWSKHVDVDPGDRAASCGGLMEPISIEGSSPEYVLTQKCTVCGHERRNVIAANDDPTSIVQLAQKQASK